MIFTFQLLKENDICISYRNDTTLLIIKIGIASSDEFHHSAKDNFHPGFVVKSVQTFFDEFVSHWVSDAKKILLGGVDFISLGHDNCNFHPF